MGYANALALARIIVSTDTRADRLTPSLNPTGGRRVGSARPIKFGRTSASTPCRGCLFSFVCLFRRAGLVRTRSVTGTVRRAAEREAGESRFYSRPVGTEATRRPRQWPRTDAKPLSPRRRPGPRTLSLPRIADRPVGWAKSFALLVSAWASRVNDFAHAARALPRAMPTLRAETFQAQQSRRRGRRLCLRPPNVPVSRPASVGSSDLRLCVPPFRSQKGNARSDPVRICATPGGAQTAFLWRTHLRPGCSSWICRLADFPRNSRRLLSCTARNRIAWREQPRPAP